MNFHDLRIIVAQLKKNISCPKCKNGFQDEDIELVGSLGDEHTFFFATCADCDVETVVNVSLQMDESETLPNLARLGTAPRGNSISTNEVLDMHNFLKDFSGDFNSLFKSKKT